LVEWLAALSRRLKIRVQERAMPGATRADADVIVSSRAGIPCALLSIPLRNMHSPVEVVDAGDLDSLASLLAGFVLSIRKNPLG
jgi:putative aminopeptidase FrvX